MHTSAVPSTTPSRWLDIKSGIVILDVLLLCAMLAWLPFDPMVNKGLGILVFIAILWLTEALHVTITALLVPLLATVLGVFDMGKSLTDFANPILFLFFGGFALAAALSKQGLDTLMAGKVMHLANGHLGWGVILLFTITAAMSMWISNTATTAMMLPLAIGMLARLDSQQDRATFVFVLLGIAYSASIGGIGTLVGSPPNAIAAAQMGIGFTDWMKFGVPVVLILMPCGIALLYLVTRPQLNHRVEIQDVTINWTRERKVTLAIFLTTVVLWIGSQPIAKALGGIPQFDTLIAMGAIIAIAVSRVASWDDINQNTDWGVLMLFGGGLTLSAILKATGTSAFLASHLSAVLADANIFIILLMLAAFVVFLTELVSNTATAALLIPLFAGVAEALGVSPVVMAVLIAIGASCAFMLPVATPPNAIVFASGHIRQKEMMKAGMALNIVFVVLLAVLAYFVGDIL
ncbi:SLC13 family permease [Aeromonas salmonicida]|uniref:SLC13 family permease n=1 Tax=Aeromonas salmonicida TaxID=645 RepID=UPI00223F40B1|nr:DASS family sodium-coupled anion symporter [Aeromonas salmonicida]HEH9410673.1 DASS family sodium-coupled anion symporter [Aeromonas salmonicida]